MGKKIKVLHTLKSTVLILFTERTFIENIKTLTFQLFALFIEKSIFKLNNGIVEFKYFFSLQGNFNFTLPLNHLIIIYTYRVSLVNETSSWRVLINILKENSKRETTQTLHEVCYRNFFKMFHTEIWLLSFSIRLWDCWTHEFCENISGKLYDEVILRSLSHMRWLFP